MDSDNNVIADLDIENSNPEGGEGTIVPPVPVDQEEPKPEDDTRVLTA